MGNVTSVNFKSIPRQKKVEFFYLPHIFSVTRGGGIGGRGRLGKTLKVHWQLRILVKISYENKKKSPLVQKSL